jgi:hypothetical protein
MSFPRHRQIYQSDDCFGPRDEAASSFAPSPFIVSMSLQPVIPWRVGLHQSPPPLHQPVSIFHHPAETVNHPPPGVGEFSAGTLGSFQPELTGGMERGVQP